jgi:hypothetical protein
MSKTIVLVKLFSFDITIMYTNIPKKELTDIIKNILDNNNTLEKQKQELRVSRKTIQQSIL